MGVSVDVLLKLGGGLFVLFIIYLLVAGAITLVLYTRIGQDTKGGFWYTDRDKLKKYIFKSWIDWAGRPSTFSYAPSTDVLYSQTYKVMTGNNISDCMFTCASVNERGKTPKCVGFIHQKGATSNTCILTSAMDGLSSIDPTSNTIYFIDGLDTARQYKLYANKATPTTTLKLLDGSPYDSGGSTGEYVRKCASNCASMSECQGLIMTGTGTSTAPGNISCALLKDGLDPTKFTTDNNSKIALFETHGPLSSSSIQYWT
jgi:hypothetical protein